MPHACTTCGRTFPDGSKEMLSGCPDCGGNKFRYHPGSVEDGDVDTGRGGSSDRAPPDPDDRVLPGRDDGVVDRATTTVKEWVSQRSDRPPASPPSTDDPGERQDPTRASGDRSEPSTAATSAAADDTPDAASGPSSPDDAGTENTAQADARSGLASPDEIPDDAGPVTEDASPGAPTPRGKPQTDGTDAPADPSVDAGPRHPRGDAEPADPAATPASSNLAQLREELNEQFESIKIVEPGQYELNLMGLYDREEYIISLMEDGRYAIEVPETWRDSEDVPSE